jgi:hypothetical protein
MTCPPGKEPHFFFPSPSTQLSRLLLFFATMSPEQQTVIVSVSIADSGNTENKDKVAE